jgi:hypothetical protein
VEHHGRIDVAKNAHFEQRIFPPPPSSAGVPMSSTVPGFGRAPRQRREGSERAAGNNCART